MESPDPWTTATIAAGRTALGASSFPLAAALAYGVGHTYGAAMAVLLPGGVLYVVAFLATLVTMAAGGRSAGLGLLGGSIASLFAQLAVLVAVAMAWSAMHESSRWRPTRSRSDFSKPRSKRRTSEGEVSSSMGRESARFLPHSP